MGLSGLAMSGAYSRLETTLRLCWMLLDGSEAFLEKAIRIGWSRYPRSPPYRGALHCTYLREVAWTAYKTQDVKYYLTSMNASESIAEIDKVKVAWRHQRCLLVELLCKPVTTIQRVRCEVTSA